jgi:DNA-directed RNA polymerase subunit RPC12/RpoP
MARNYGEDDGDFSGLSDEDLDRQEPIGQQLAADWGPFEIWGRTKDCAELVPAAGACPHCGSADLLAVEEDMGAPAPEIDAEGEERTELRCPTCSKKVVVVRRLVLDRIEKGE